MLPSLRVLGRQPGRTAGAHPQAVTTDADLRASGRSACGRGWSKLSSRPVALLPFVLVSFAANSLVTRYVVGNRLLDAGLLGAARFLAGAMALVGLATLRHERLIVGRPNLGPALWLGTYALCISYGYRYIGAAAGTFIFYATVLLTLVAYDLATGSAVSARRAFGAAVSLAGIAVLAAGSASRVTVPGVVLLAAAGAAWGMYTAAGRVGVGDPLTATTGHFVVLAALLVVPAGVGVTAGLRVTAAGLAWAVMIGVGTTAFAYVAWYACQRSMSGTSAGSAQLVIPLLTAAGAVLLLGEQLSVTLLLAAVLIGAGLWMARPHPRSQLGGSR